MRTVQRSLRLDAPPAVAWEACIELLHAPDPARGIVARRCEPEPPRAGGVLVTTTRAAGGGTRELRSRFVEVDPPRALTTASEDDGPSVRTRLAVEPEGSGSRVTVTSEAATGLTGRPGPSRLLDGVILGRAQRRSARATLRRVRELASVRDST
jgi:hypothetical protein